LFKRECLLIIVPLTQPTLSFIIVSAWVTRCCQCH